MVSESILSEKSFLLPPPLTRDSCNNTISIKRRLGLLNGVTLIVGAIVGTGIFVSPKGVLKETGSVGMALMVWSLTGLFSMMGAMCYIELGTTFPMSGCDFTYMRMCFGELPAFLYLWVFIVIIGPVGNAIAALAFANYVLQPFFPTCLIPQSAVRLIAGLILCKYLI
ncbi:large neutral amino acids transporter small subunit 2 [Trichonephila inaurata madagascariensis]|uniref:Large neutral amino acids transporter small subunit 2 n=1 Tax=Trichonephila inaurata madagascariensis TaxID=2747483 RepID=A0A8X6XH26_9ARAC|nr:large neutral amino acids transporter small subunit 2 [Trichonephila inaurata madagascariensis]